MPRVNKFISPNQLTFRRAILRTILDEALKDKQCLYLKRDLKNNIQLITNSEICNIQFFNVYKRSIFTSVVLGTEVFYVVVIHSFVLQLVHYSFFRNPTFLKAFFLSENFD